MTYTRAQEHRIRELFRLLTAEKDPERVQELAGELSRLLVVQAPLKRPSHQQLRIIELVANGSNNREIAEELGLSRYVVRNYLSKIYAEVGVNNRVQLALWYEEQLRQEKLRQRKN